MSKGLYFARERGRQAYRDGQPITSNPYVDPSLKEAWANGHKEEKEDYNGTQPEQDTGQE